MVFFLLFLFLAREELAREDKEVGWLQVMWCARGEKCSMGVEVHHQMIGVLLVSGALTSSVEGPVDEGLLEK